MNRRVVSFIPVVLFFFFFSNYVKAISLSDLLTDAKRLNYENIEIDDLIQKAEQEDPKAQFDLGVIYAHGIGVPQDSNESLKWRKRAAEQGYERAQYALGLIYYYGLDVPEDTQKSLRWLNKSAEQNGIGSQYYLGNIYEEGEIVKQNIDESLKWYRKAAEGGLLMLSSNSE